MTTSATANSKMHFILIGVAVGCVLLAGTVFFVIRAVTAPTVSLSTAAASMALQIRYNRALHLKNHQFPSPTIKKLLEGWKSNKTFVVKQGDVVTEPKSYEDMLVQLAVNQKFSSQRAQFLMNMTAEDYSKLIMTYAFGVKFEADNVETDDERLHAPVVKRHTYVAKEMEPVKVEEPAGVSTHVYDPVLISKYFHPTKEHMVESLIEMAGFGKGETTLTVEPWLEDNLYSAFGSDYVGVSKDGTVVALADGVGGAAGSEMAAKAVVEMAVSLLSHHKVSLHTHSWRLLNTMVSFMQNFELTGKTTFVVAQIEKSALGGAKVTVLNVGDSGVAIVDKNGVPLVRTGVSLHNTNQPCQLKSSIISDPANAQLFEYQAPAGSRVLVFSDGMPDNLYPRFYGKAQRAPEIAAYVAATVHDRAGPAKAPFGQRKKDDDVSIAVVRV